MAERDTIVSSKIKSDGIFSFKDFYKFCYDWIQDETQLEIFSEDKYVEKLVGEAKNIEIQWTASRKVTDYFMFELRVNFRILNLVNVELTKDGQKIKTNKGSVEVKIKGTLIKDYEGKFDRSAFRKFLRSIYDKWVISSRIDQMEGKLVEEASEFLNQSKAYLDLEGKK